MSGYGLFQPSTLGMKSQSHKLNTIGYNIANVNTGGFKRTDTEFETVLSDKIFAQSDIGGVKPYARATNDVQGLVKQSDRNLDVAIVGDGFFSVQTEISGGDIYFTRDGSFGINTVDGQTSSVTADDGSTITVSNGYLVDKSGYFVRGIPANEDGTFTLSSAAAPMRVDQYAFTGTGQQTTQAMLEFNLPANANFGDDAETFTLRTYDSAANERNISFDFSKTLTDNEWRIDVRADNLTTGGLTPASPFSTSVGGTTGNELRFDTGAGTIQVINATTGIPVAEAFSGLKVGDQVTLAGTASNDNTYTISAINDIGSTLTLSGGVTAEADTGATAVTISSTANITQRLVFSDTGQLTSPTELTFSATWDDGSTSSFAIDISDMTQFDGNFTPFSTSQNGLGMADIVDVTFDGAGHVVGTFSDGTQRQIYKIPLFDFTNPNGLESLNGMVFRETTESGAATEFFADLSSKADLQPNAIEISNVDIAQEFTRMMLAQNAYNMSATSFKTIDEMTTVARDLKS